MRVDDVASYAIRRSDIVRGREVRECPPEIVEQALVLIGDCDACGTSLP
jgi:hypothetical protein